MRNCMLSLLFRQIVVENIVPPLYLSIIQVIEMMVAFVARIKYMVIRGRRGIRPVQFHVVHIQEKIILLVFSYPVNCIVSYYLCCAILLVFAEYFFYLS